MEILDCTSLDPPPGLRPSRGNALNEVQAQDVRTSDHHGANLAPVQAHYKVVMWRALALCRTSEPLKPLA